MSRSRKGFTLIELLVVIAIIGLLISIAIPAVQKVRENANRMKCSNNLKQIGIALHSYHDSHKIFPSGYVAGAPPVTGPGWGWGAYLLPFVEEASLFQQIDFNSDIAAAVNATPRTHVLNVFRCPSDSPLDLFTASNTPTIVAFANYVGMFGTPEITVNPDADSGVFFRNSSIGFKDIADGGSNTIAIAERHSYLANSTWVGAVTGAEVPPNHPSMLGPEGECVLCLGHTGVAAEGHTPNNPTNHVDDFGSYHSNGANCVFVDGSVRFISANVSPVVWEALGTRSGGEPLSATDY